jgi:hypothetical protein
VQGKIYSPPFVPERFFFIPIQWTQRITGLADLDAIHLLLAMHLEHHLIAFSPHQAEAYWVRRNDEGLPNLVSHVSFRTCVDTLRSRGWIEDCIQDDLDTSLTTSLNGCYRLVEWPQFGGHGLFYLPRRYIHNRWPVLLKSNGWGVKGALMGLAFLMSEHHSSQPGALPSITASRTQIAKAADRVLGDSTASPKVGNGLRQLKALGLLTEDSTRTGKHNRWYTLRSDCFDKPPEWPLAEVAHRCGLDLDADREWVILIQAFLQANYKPIEESSTIWQLIRSTFPYLDADLDPQSLVADLRRRMGRHSTEVKRVLKDAHELHRLRGRQHWGESEWVEVNLGSSSTLSPELRISIPDSAKGRTQVTVLVIQCLRRRISVEDTLRVLSALTIEMRQGAAIHPIARQIVADSQDVQTHKTLRANHLHPLVDYSEPFQLLFTLKDGFADNRLTLRCRIGVQFT